MTAKKLFDLSDPRFNAAVIGLALIAREWLPWWGLDYFPAWETTEKTAHILWAQAIAVCIARPRCKWAWIGAIVIASLTWGFVPWLFFGHGADLPKAGCALHYLICCAACLFPGSSWEIPRYIFADFMTYAVLMGIIAKAIRVELGGWRIMGRVCLATIAWMLILALFALVLWNLDWRYRNTIISLAERVVIPLVFWSIVQAQQGPLDTYVAWRMRSHS